MQDARCTTTNREWTVQCNRAVRCHQAVQNRQSMACRHRMCRQFGIAAMWAVVWVISVASPIQAKANDSKANDSKITGNTPVSVGRNASSTGRASDAATSNTSECVLRIYPTAVVTSATVTLGDVAALSGDNARAAGSWVIAQAPAPGQEITIEADALQQWLIRRGVNASMWVLRGSTKCRISRPMQSGITTPLMAAVPPTSADASRNSSKSRTIRGIATTMPADLIATVSSGQIANTVAATSAMNAGTTSASVPTSVPTPDTLEAAMYEFVGARLASLGGRPSISVSPALQGLLQLSRPTYDFHITNSDDRLLGLVSLEVAIYRDGKLEQKQLILANVSLMKSVVIASGVINRGQTIRSDDITLREQKFDRVDRIGMSDLKAVVGQRAVSNIAKDTMIVAKDLEPVMLVVRGDLVTVIAKKGNVSIRTVAKAVGPAKYGEMVELRYDSLRSKESFTAMVTGPKTAELLAETANSNPNSSPNPNPMPTVSLNGQEK
ncbi:MAG: flagellar basal body P-ring formation chaperone FlgA [Phycisphaerae bacterium]|nr:flagellar basal body P-ring formation chaperone FlgA [Phycisphaerae bacterium]